MIIPAEPKSAAGDSCRRRMTPKPASLQTQMGMLDELW